MLPSLITLYSLSAILVLICAFQRSKDEEELNEYYVFLVPIGTIIFAGLLLLAMRIFSKGFINNVILTIFCICSWYTVICNFVYLVEVGEYRYARLFDIDISSSDFEEIVIHPNKEEVPVRRPKTRNIFKRFYRWVKKIFKNLTVASVIGFVIGGLLVAGYHEFRSWFFEDLLSISICFQTLRELKVDCVYTAYVQLILLIVYDIFWLFARGWIDETFADIEVPMKIVFPKYFHGFDMVGLGDIFIPGLYLNIIKNFCDRRLERKRFVFWVTWIGFVVGIIVTLVSIVYMEIPIPSLIAVCPLMVIFSFLASLQQGCFREMVEYKRGGPSVERFTRLRKFTRKTLSLVGIRASN